MEKLESWKLSDSCDWNSSWWRNTYRGVEQYQFSCSLTDKELETQGCIYNTVATDTLMLKH